MSRTGQQLLTDFSEFIGDDFVSSVTSTSTSLTELVDTALGRWGDRALQDWWIRITQADTNANLVRRIATNVQATGRVTLRSALAELLTSADTYELHKYDPADKFQALEEARIEVGELLFAIVRDDTITMDGRQTEFDIPSGMRVGPEVAIIERPLQFDMEQNVLTTPKLDSTTGWTAGGGVVASTYDRTQSDLLIPKHGQTVTKIVYTDAGSDGTYTQAVSAMDSDKISAAGAAGRHMTFGSWMYNETAGAVAEILDDGGTATSSAHTGGGWEFLQVSKDIDPTNATTLTTRYRFPNSGAAAHRTAYLEGAWFGFGKLPEMWFDRTAVQIERDDTIQKWWFTNDGSLSHLRGHNVRLVGRDTLSSLGDTLSTQPTNSMEVDEESSQLLFAAAATILFGKEFLNTEAPRRVLDRIQAVQARIPNLRRQWQYDSEVSHLVSPYGNRVDGRR